MPGKSYNYRLRKASREKVLSNSLGGVVAVHEWHIAIHQDELVPTLTALEGLHAFFDLLESFSAVIG